MPGSLPHSPARIVRQMLIDLAHGTDPTDNGSWPVFAKSEPNSPDNCITVYDTQGTQSGRTAFDGERQEEHGIQIRVRATTDDIGEPKTRLVYLALDQDVYRTTVTIDSSTYLVQAISTTSMLSLGKEITSSKRNIYTINSLVSVRLVTDNVVPSNALVDSSGNTLLDALDEILTGV